MARIYQLCEKHLRAALQKAGQTVPGLREELSPEEHERTKADLERLIPNPHDVPGIDPRLRISYTRYRFVDDSGDYEDENGWINEEGESMAPDEWDREDGKTAPDLVVAYIESQTGRVEPSSSPGWHRGIWYSTTSNEPDDEGWYEERHYHLSGFTDKEEQQIYKALTRP